MLHHPCILGGPQQREQNQKTKSTLGVTMMLHGTKRGFKDCPVSSIAPERWGPKEGGNATSPLHSWRSPTNGAKSEVKTYARGHHDAPRNKAWIQRFSGFLNSTGTLGLKRGRKCHVTLAFSAVPNKRSKIRSQNVR